MRVEAGDKGFGDVTRLVITQQKGKALQETHRPLQKKQRMAMLQ